MYLIPFFIVAGILLIVLANIVREFDDESKEILIGLGIVLIFLASWAVPIAIGLLQQHPEYTIEIVERRTLELLSIKDNFKFSGGSAFVGISQDMYYYYYTQELGDQFNPDGAITLNKIYVGSVKLYEDAPEGEGYFIERWKIVTFLEEYSKWSIILPKPDTRSRLLAREIHVPPGTVLRQFVLNAE